MLKFKIGLIAAAVASLAAAMTAMYQTGAQTGEQRCAEAEAAKLDALRKVQQRIADELSESRRQILQLRDRQVDAIAGTKDAAGCADARVPGRVLDILGHKPD